jgi:hypothetical protein
MKKLLSLGIATALLAVAGAAFAFPTIQGPTGGFDVPNADVAKGWIVAIDEEGGLNSPIPQARLLYGVIPALEIGAVYGKPQTEFRDWGLNAKYKLPNLVPDLKWAVGVEYLKNEGSSSPQDSTVSGYLAGSYPLAFLDNTTLIVALSVDDNQPSGGDAKTKLSPQIGLEKTFSSSLTAGVEGVFNKAGHTDNYYNIYANLPLNNDLTLRAALNGINDQDQQGTTLDLGLAYAFGAGK